MFISLFISFLHWAPMNNYLFCILVVFGGTWNIIQHYDLSWRFLFSQCLSEHLENTLFCRGSVISVWLAWSECWSDSYQLKSPQQMIFPFLNLFPVPSINFELILAASYQEWGNYICWCTETTWQCNLVTRWVLCRPAVKLGSVNRTDTCYHWGFILLWWGLRSWMTWGLCDVHILNQILLSRK